MTFSKPINIVVRFGGGSSGGGASIAVDATLNVNSMNAIANKAVASKFNEVDEAKADKVRVDNHQTESEVTIQPNVMNVWTDSVSDLTITKGDAIEGIVNNYMIRFTASANAKITLEWDGTQVTWYGGEEPTWTDGKIYEISIVDNIALWAEF